MCFDYSLELHDDDIMSKYCNCTCSYHMVMYIDTVDNQTKEVNEYHDVDFSHLRSGCQVNDVAPSDD